MKRLLHLYVVSIAMTNLTGLIFFRAIFKDFLIFQYADNKFTYLTLSCVFASLRCRHTRFYICWLSFIYTGHF